MPTYRPSRAHTWSLTLPDMTFYIPKDDTAFRHNLARLALHHNMTESAILRMLVHGAFIEIANLERISE